MAYINLPPELAQVLVNIKDRTELRAPNGVIMGIFVPREKCETRDWGECSFSPEEIEEAERILKDKNQEWVTLEEIWRKLGRYKENAQ